MEDPLTRHRLGVDQEPGLPLGSQDFHQWKRRSVVHSEARDPTLQPRFGSRQGSASGMP
jgi:hypothetical protein